MVIENIQFLQGDGMALVQETPEVTDGHPDNEDANPVEFAPDDEVDALVADLSTEPYEEVVDDDQ